MKRTKIMYVVNQLFKVGGIEKIVIDKANYLSLNTDYEISIFVLGYENNNSSFFRINESIKIHSFTDFVKSESKLRDLFFMINQIRKAVRKASPDIIIFTRPFFLESSIIQLLSPKSIKIIELHACFEVFNYGEAYFNDFVKKQDKSFKKFSDKLFSLFSLFVTSSKRDIDLWGYRNMLFLPNFTTMEPQKVSTLDSKKAIAVGRLVYQKGFDILIKSWVEIKEKYKDWILEIWGDGSEREMLQDLINKLNLQDVVHLKGYATNVVDVYSSASMFIMSSRYEGFGIVLVDAQKCGLPIVTFDLPSGPGEIVNHEKDGFVCEYMNQHQISEGVKKLIEDDNLRKSMRNNAIENAKQYSPENVMPYWVDQFERLLCERKSLVERMRCNLISMKCLLLFIKSYIKNDMKFNS